MDGATLRSGAIANVNCVRNPVFAARKVMENSKHVLFVGEGAEAFAKEQGLDIVDPSYFSTEARREQLLRVQRETPDAAVLDHDGQAMVARGQPAPADPLDADKKFGTVGAVAVDAQGNLAAATSTGGITNKQVGRVGDAPLIGAGTYASNKTCAVSTTGTGEMFIRMVAAYDVAAQMEYCGASLEAAADRVVMEKLPTIGGKGGLVAVDAQGNVALPFNTEGMYRGYARVGEKPVTAIYR
jgi:beta-aspartyl-peptidase (threonine type)